MSFPPPPGLNKAPSSLPPRPPPSSNAAQPPVPGYGGNARPAFTGFQPRSVASSQPQPYRASNPTISAPPVSSAGYATPVTNYSNYYQQSQPQSYQSGPSYYGASYNEPTYGPTVPHIQNPFGSTPGQAYGGGRPGRDGLDAETEAQIAQWQSAYSKQDDSTHTQGTPSAAPSRGTGTPTTGVAGAGTPIPQPESQKTVARAGGGQEWTDSTLLEWDPAHFRLFVGNLAGEVTDESLLKAFARYTSVQKARVIREKRTQKSKGYGFVSFSDGDDYFKAAREMQGKYIGSHPVLLRRAVTEVKPVSNNKNHKKGGGGGRGGHSGAKVKHDGVKKSGKTKGGLKILG
ncbi:uncharacterized protein N7484_004319 [Penicillium longicatenatum]|uniref:uncharacterized protein n=1 Tax=Penicillium longicatenatum TaxID=1561947 RepID=UPI002548824C|nr:uncharacterized protein N7484_004319 [Penicillium longicatenatum]KAJ5650596.1 hypothetical protein N7484_004319 [Penicillium longicatenatum]